MTLGAVWDLGSSSFQVLVCSTGPSHCLKVVAQRRALLNLGMDVGTSGSVPVEKAKAAMAAVKRLRRAVDGLGPDLVVAVATAALRDAANGPEVVSRLERHIGAPVRLLSGEEEARLCFVGQRAGVHVGETPVLGIDLGGGSFEMAIGNRFDIYATASAPLGATRLKAEMGVGGTLDRADRKEVRERVRESIAGTRLPLARYRSVARRTIVSGGTARALARLATSNAAGRPPGPGWAVNQVELPVEQLAEMADTLGDMELEERLRLPGVPARRAPVLPLGACILQAIAEELDVGHYVVSEWGLREGALLAALAGHNPGLKTYL